MKKYLKKKGHGEPWKFEPNIGEIVTKIQYQLTSLERKVDALISQGQGAAARPVEEKRYHEPARRPDQPQPYQRSDARPVNNFRDRVLHKAVCADCGKGCEVPFKPANGRPVYCKECFGKRKAPHTFAARSDARPPAASVIPAIHSDKPHDSEKKAPIEKKPVEREPARKKRPAVKRRKLLTKRQ